MVQPGDWFGSRYARYKLPFRPGAGLEFVDKHNGFIYNTPTGGTPIGRELPFRNFSGNDAAIKRVTRGVSLKVPRSKRTPVVLRDADVVVASGD